MFKNKTEQNRNDEKYNQTDKTVKIHSNHDGVWANMIMLKSIAARSSWRSPVITASLRNYTGRPSSEKIRACSDILSDALSGRPHQSLQPSSMALSSQAIVMFRWMRLLFILKTLALNSLFSTCHVEKLACFYESQVSWSSLNISLSDSVLETKTLQANSLCFLLENLTILR